MIAVFVMYFFTLGFSTPREIGNGDKDSGGISTSGNGCADLVAKYDKKIFNISLPQKFKGTVGVSIDNNTCEYRIVWHELYSSNKIVKNMPNASMPILEYNYFEDVVFAREGSKPMDGQIQPVYQNKDQLPPDAFTLRIPFDLYNPKEIQNGTTKNAQTDTFSHIFEQSGTISQSTIDSILSVKKVRVYGADNANGKLVEEFDIEVKNQ